MMIPTPTPALAQGAVEPRHPWDAIVAALNDFYLRVLGLPEQASTIAPVIDRLHYFQITVMFAVAGVIGLVTLIFVLRFRRRAEDQVGRRVRPPHSVEIGIYAGLFSLFMFFWILGFRQFARMDIPPEDAIDVYVSAKQWVWKFAYEEGPASVGVLYVPVGRPIRLRLTSRDVIHSFFVPTFRIKRDAVPGIYTSIWFEATEPGRFPVLCAEMCGVGHSRMRAEVVVLPQEAFDDWLNGRPVAMPSDPVGTTSYGDRGAGPDEAGRIAEIGRAAAVRHGCFQCHTVDGSPGRGPTWHNLYGAQETMRTGEVIYVNPAYITQSMMEPEAEIVAGFPPIMPSYQGRISAAEVGAIIEFMKANSPSPGLRRGRETTTGPDLTTTAPTETAGGATPQSSPPQDRP